MTDVSLKEYLTARLKGAGASAVGFATAGEVDGEASTRFRSWLAQGREGELGYMRRYPDLRRDPRLLLESARTVVSAAWCYLPPQLRDGSLPVVARYAYGRDYHKALRSLIKPICRDLEASFGCRWRICIDSAPIAERYWAVKSGVGFIGRNGCLIVPGVGSWVFLSEILLTAATEPDAPLPMDCEGCDACRRQCPGGAIGADRTVDVRHCLSACTVEGTPYPDVYTERPHLLGCDRCQEVCPHNRGAAPSSWMRPLDGILSLNDGELRAMDDGEFTRRFAGTSFMRPGKDRLLSNLSFWENSRIP